MNTWQDGYVYWGDVVRDLQKLISEYIAECEHEGIKPRAKELHAGDAVLKEREERLIKDFLAYHAQ